MDPNLLTFRTNFGAILGLILGSKVVQKMIHKVTKNGTTFGRLPAGQSKFKTTDLQCR